MAQDPSPESALAEIRLAYRLVAEYQRMVLDLVEHLSSAIVELHPALRFRSWAPQGYAAPPQPDANPLAGAWSFEFLPLYNVALAWSTASSPVPGALHVWITHTADDAFPDKAAGEPRPEALPQPASTRTLLGVHAVAVRRIEPDRNDWQDLVRLANGPRGTVWEDGQVHTFNSRTQSFSFGGLRVDASRIASSTAASTELIEPALALMRSMR